MHIAFFIYSLSGGGAERVTCNMAEYWSKSGHQVTILTMADVKDNRYKLAENITLIPLGTATQSKNSLHALLNNINQVLELRKALKQLKPDQVIAMMSHAIVMAALACIRLPVKCIGSERTFPGLDNMDGPWQLLRKYCYRLPDTIVVQNEICKTWIDNNTSASNSVVIPNQLTLPLPSHPPIVKPSSRTGASKHIIGVGRLDKKKQFEHLITAFQKLHRHHEDWDLSIIGEGQDHEALQKLINQHELNDRVSLVGRVGNIADWYRHANILALTSKTEGFPNVLIEAMAHGMTVVSYDCPTGPAELIKHGTNGILVPPNNIGELEHQIGTLMRNETLRESLAKEATKIIEKLHPSVVMAEWEQLL